VAELRLTDSRLSANHARYLMGMAELKGRSPTLGEI
jgi:hypothetical protein